MASPAIPSESRHATGPRTAEGKARSSQNARKHGLSAVSLSVLPAEQADFDVYQNELLEMIRPEAGLQADLFRQLVHAGWSLVRLERYELEILAQGNPFDSPEAQAKLDRLERYRNSHHRRYSRTLDEIRKLQTATMLWNSTHDCVRTALRNELPLANPAVRDVAKHLRVMSDEAYNSDAARLIDADPSGFTSYFDKTNSSAPPAHPVSAPART